MRVPRVLSNNSNLSQSNRSPNTSSSIFRSPVAEIDPSTPKYAIFAIFTNKDATSKPQPRTEIDPILTLNASKPGVIQKNAIRIAPDGLGPLFPGHLQTTHLRQEETRGHRVAQAETAHRQGGTSVLVVGNGALASNSHRTTHPTKRVALLHSRARLLLRFEVVFDRLGNPLSLAGREVVRTPLGRERSSFCLREFDYALTDTDKEDPTTSVIVEAALALLKYLHSSSPCSDILFEKNRRKRSVPTWKKAFDAQDHNTKKVREVYFQISLPTKFSVNLAHATANMLTIGAHINLSTGPAPFKLPVGILVWHSPF
ncbi:hypothetical protein B0H13DRAFT_2301271 [Mycena leptocephala]|nr:hypothetical protein B0H13DRAFT_2301271 [Mycena leptocephala]